MAAHPVRFPRKDDGPPSLPGYEIGEVIGRGAMGVVYRARQLNVDREVALKVLHPELSGQPRLVRRLQREARTTARLAHPHVVSAIDMGEVDGAWWYAMEYVDGPSLSLRLRQEGRLKEREVLRLFIPLCEALEHLFEHGVVHRDIKPANILIGRRGGACLADLGLAFADDDPNASGQGGMLGTPHYISPEQAVDASNADVRSDIWSFGATLYHALCGSPPFSGNSTAEILSEVLYSQVTDPRELEPSLSKGMALVLRKCLSREPEKRYQTPHELLLDLERVREHRAPKVRRQALEPVRRARRVQRWLLLGASVGALSLAVIVWSVMTGRDEADGQLQVVELAPYAPLESILQRARERPRDLAQHRSALADLRPELHPGHVERWQEIDRELRGALRERVDETQREVLADIELAFEERRFRAAEQALREVFPALIFERTGYRVEQLEEVGASSLTPWLERTASRVEERLEAVTRELQEALVAWTERRREQVDVLLSRHDWRGALALLEAEPETMLAESGHGDIELPSRFLDQAVELGAASELLRTREEVKARWRELDRELFRKVRTRAETLESELEEGKPRPEAARALGEWFELELVDDRLSRDRMPVDLAVTCLEELERSQRSLRLRESVLLERDMRAEVEQTQDLGVRYWKERRYGELSALWHKVAMLLAELSEREDGDWRSELEALALRRREEADLLARLLRTASARVRDLNGMTIQELRVGAITYSNRRVLAPTDPLSSGGFQLEGLNRRIDLRALPSDQLQWLAGMTEAAELSPENRLMLAAFLFHEQRFLEANELLRTDLFPGGPLHDLERDLGNRVRDAVELQRRHREVRIETARSLLDTVFATDSQVHSPSSVVSRIDLLLDDYADLEVVRPRLGDLRELRGSLIATPDGSLEELLQSEFGPTRISFPRQGRVAMEFDFADSIAGAWRRGDWVFDGVGWIAEQRSFDWQGFADQRGPRLVLSAPIESDSFDLTLDLEMADSGPPQLLTVSIAGFHLGLSGPGLPGAGQGSRYLVRTGDFDAFMRRLRDGEGEEVEALLEEGAAHRLRLRGYRPSGRLRIELDGRALREVRAQGQAVISSVLEIRSWDRIRLRRAQLEVGR